MGSLPIAIYFVGVVGWAIVVAVVAYRDPGLGTTVNMMGMGPLAMGFVAAGLNWLIGNKLDGRFVWIALCVSLALLILLPVVAVMEDFGTIETQLCLVWLVVAAAGFAYGWVSWQRRQAAESSVAEAALATSANTCDGRRGDFPRARRARYVPALFWFTLGLVLAAGLALLAGWISYAFVDRGPILFRTEWGGVIRARDQQVDMATGLLIPLIGWLLGLAGMWFRLPRSLSIGLIAGATLFGLIFGAKGR